MPFVTVPEVLLTLYYAEPRNVSAASSNRWAGRSNSQTLRRKNWVAPDASKLRRTGTITRYADEAHVLGEASAADIERMSDYYSQGPAPDKRPSYDQVPETDAAYMFGKKFELDAVYTERERVIQELDAAAPSRPVAPSQLAEDQPYHGLGYVVHQLATARSNQPQPATAGSSQSQAGS